MIYGVMKKYQNVNCQVMTKMKGLYQSMHMLEYLHIVAMHDWNLEKYQNLEQIYH